MLSIRWRRVTYTPRSRRPKDSRPWAARIIKDRRKTLPSSMRDPFWYSRSPVPPVPNRDPATSPSPSLLPAAASKIERAGLDYARVGYE